MNSEMNIPSDNLFISSGGQFILQSHYKELFHKVSLRTVNLGWLRGSSMGVCEALCDKIGRAHV